MSLQNSLVPRCRAVAVTTKDGTILSHYCEHPSGHDGDHGARAPGDGMWISWSHIVHLSTTIPPLPEETRA